MKIKHLTLSDSSSLGEFESGLALLNDGTVREVKKEYGYIAFSDPEVADLYSYNLYEVFVGLITVEAGDE